MENQVAHRVREDIAIENARLLADMQNRLAQLAASGNRPGNGQHSGSRHPVKIDHPPGHDLLQAESGILNLVDWERGEDEVVACTGKASSEHSELTIPLVRPSPGWVSLHNQPEISSQSRTIRALTNA